MATVGLTVTRPDMPGKHRASDFWDDTDDSYYTGPILGKVSKREQIGRLRRMVGEGTITLTEAIQLFRSK
jgi:hypothetical protein